MTDHRHASATSHGGATGIVRLHTHHETYMHTHHALLQSQSKAEGGACKRIRRLIQRIPTRLPPLPSAGTLSLSSSPWVPVGIVWLLRCPRFPAGHGVRRLMRGRMRHGAARDALHHMLQGGHSCVKVTSIPTALSLSLSLCDRALDMEAATCPTCASRRRHYSFEGRAGEPGHSAEAPSRA